MRSKAPPRFSLLPLITLVCFLAGMVMGIALIYYAHHGGRGTIGAVLNPAGEFPGQQSINVLIMGIDENWTEKDMPFTKSARTDTLFVVRFDLATQRAYLLSIPRDSRVRIAGTNHWGKINGAFTTGGVQRSLQTVSNFLGVPLDYYVVLKMDATRSLVDSIGGVDINVEKDMNYDDSWGHLHIHLTRGPQHLNGEQAVGYIRFRHDREGDFGRIRRQQQLLHAITQRLKSPVMLPRLPSIMETFQQSVATNFSRSQLMALAQLFKNLSPTQIVSAYIPGTDERISNVEFLIPDEDRKQLLTDWLLRGNAASEIPLLQVAVENGCGNASAAQAVRERLSAAGFHAFYDGDADRSDYASTQVIDYDRFKGGGALVAARLGIPAVPMIQPDPQASPNVVVIVGRDLGSSAMAAR
jgi:polyisoprenyl-teichoic acid--peptidoglycan teichoic acid transferase